MDSAIQTLIWGRLKLACFGIEEDISWVVRFIFGIYFGLAMEGISLIQPVAGHFMDIFGIVAVFNIIALTGIALSLIALFFAIKPKLQ